MKVEMNDSDYIAADLCHREVIVESYERGKHINEFIDKNKNTITKKGIALNQRIARIGVRMCLKMVRIPQYYTL